MECFNSTYPFSVLLCSCQMLVTSRPSTSLHGQQLASFFLEPPEPCRCSCCDLVRCSEHCGLSTRGPPPCKKPVSHGAFPRLCCGFTQASDGPWTVRNLRAGTSTGPGDLCDQPALLGVHPWLLLAGLGHQMGVPEVVFNSGFSHYRFRGVSQPRGGLPLLGQMMTCSASSCVMFTPLRYMRNGPTESLNSLLLPPERRSWVLVHRRRSPPPALLPHHRQRGSGRTSLKSRCFHTHSKP